MTGLVIIKKNGTFLAGSSSPELYKCCNYRSPKDFVKLHEWGTFELWGKSTGKAGNENKCELPSPHENTLFFGNLCVLKQGTDLSLTEWTDWYNEKMGGSENIENIEDEVSVDSEVFSDDEYTTEGYLKDSFIVDELVEESYE